MGGVAHRPSLARWSLFAVTWHFSVWVGWALVVVAAFAVQPIMGEMPYGFWVIAALVLLGELTPVMTAGRYDPQGTVTSTAFVLAMLYLWGFWPAVLLQAGACVISETVKRKDAWKLFFNVGQYAISLFAAWGVMWLFGVQDGVGAGSQEIALHATDLLWIVLTWVAWFVVNNTLVAGVSGDEGSTFRDAWTEDLGHYVVTHAAVMALSPLVVLAAQASSWFIPLLLIPLYAVRKMGQISLAEEHQATHDSLTGLPNRKFLLQTMQDGLSRCERGCEPFALFILDLDRFKDVNDTLGHQTGDQLLQLVAKRIRTVLKETDVVARLGGDEFAILLPRIQSQDEAIEVARRVRSALVESFHLDDVLLELEASIGVAMHPHHGAEVDSLMRRADVAMYLAKETHADVEIYDAQRDQHSTNRLGLLGALRHAIDNGQLELHYQPKVSLLAHDLVGVEALLRWNHPQRGPIPPDEFIPLAETSGLMHRLTSYVIDRALGQASEWRRMGLDVAVAVNVSARDLHGTELALTVSEGLARHRVPASHLVLELTERTLMAEHSRVMDTLDALEALDVAISLDDFGTGYSSMFMLRRLPVTEIKVDRSFVSRMNDGEEDESIVRSIIDLAHSLGMVAVAEGVETSEVWARLEALGCDSAQGWFVSRPMAPEVATAWLEMNAPRVGDRPLRLLTGGATGVHESA